jgi:hypothetical protein
LKNFLRSEYLPVALLILAGLLVCIATTHDYGEGWDEYNFFRYAGESLTAYPGLFQPGFHLTFYDPTLRYYGAWFLMLIVLISRLFPQWYISDIAHLVTFCVFEAGVGVLYLLARRWLKPWAAFGTALLFATQPLLWGHAFINARDIPFMVGFMASLYLGLRLVDSLSGGDLPAARAKSADSSAALRKELGTLNPLVKVGLSLAALIGILAAAWLTMHLIALWQSQAAYLADPTSVHAIDLYLRPILAVFWGAVIFILLTLTWSSLVFLPFLPGVRSALWQDEISPSLARLAGYLRSPTFLGAALLLGLTVGVRILGFAAGALVIGYMFWKQGRKALIPAAFYVLLALPIVYISWPYLWGEPLLRSLITLRVMLRFPWPGQVLFDGAYYAGDQVPHSYLPTLLSLQLTEPLLLLALVGLLLATYQAIRTRRRADLLVLALVWFGAPLAVVSVGHSYLYDNFRQFLFILPPVFLLAGLAIEQLLDLFTWTPGRAAILLAAALPGIVAGVQLHPYEYIYYNSLTGGVAGAFRRYEMDYWSTAFRASAGYLNAQAPQGASVLVWGSNSALWRYVRPDIKVYDHTQADAPSSGFYAVLSTRGDSDLTNYQQLTPLFSVDRQGALLAVIKYVPASP